MIKMKILLIGLATALVLLASVPAMATNIECDDCSMQVVVTNNTDKEQRVAINDDKCMPTKGATMGYLQPGESYTDRMEFDKDAPHCREMGIYAHNNGYFTIGSILDPIPPVFPLVRASKSKWEVKVGSAGIGGKIHFSALTQKESEGNLDCQIAGMHKIVCSVNE